MEGIALSQVTIVEPLNEHVIKQLLALDGVFQVLEVNPHTDIIVNRARDGDVSETFLHSFQNASMRLAMMRIAANVYKEPAGRFCSAILEYDRVAIVLLPVNDNMADILLLKEHATSAIEQAKTILESRHP